MSQQPCVGALSIREHVLPERSRWFGTVRTPEFGAESITEGTLVEWQKKVGDTVNKGDILAIIETDKVSIDVTAQEDGILQEIKVKVDSTVTADQPLAEIGSAAKAQEKTVPPPSVKSVQVKVPEFGAESITEGTLVEWQKKAGDSVSKGDILAIIETDKVSVDVTAPEDGVLENIMAEIDQTVETGELLADINPVATSASPVMEKSVVEEGSVVEKSAVEIKVPEFGAESITEGTLMEWQCDVGDFVDKNAVIAIIETDKVSVDVTSDVAGTVKKLLVDLESTVQVNESVAIIAPGAEPSVAVPSVEAPSAKASPSEPVKDKTAPPKKVSSPKKAPQIPQKATPVGHRGERREKMTRMRQSIARNLKMAQDTAAMLTTFQEVDMSGIINMRKKYKDLFTDTHGIKLGFMSPFVMASTRALQRIPGINAVIDDSTMEIVYRDFVDISIAVASPAGLVVPVLRDCQTKSFSDIEHEIMDLALKARGGKLTLAEMTGGTFTISNGGIFGSMLGTPIINASQSAVLGMHATKMRPVVLKNGEIVARPVMYLALSYDHRLVDGREAATFLCTVRDLVEDPERMLLDI